MDSWSRSRLRRICLHPGLLPIRRSRIREKESLFFTSWAFSSEIRAKKSCAKGIVLVYFLPLINNIAELCKGSTPVSGTVCLGSNPSSAAIQQICMLFDPQISEKGICGFLFHMKVNENISLTSETDAFIIYSL